MALMGPVEKMETEINGIRGEFIFPFQGHNKSHLIEQNFVWRQDNVYIMDNHRAALWCWLQHMDVNRKYNLLHIDQHTDTLTLRHEVRQAFSDELSELSLNDYLRRTCIFVGGAPQPAIQADNFLSFFLDRHPHNLNRLVMATHGIGDFPNWQKQESVPIHELPGSFSQIVDGSYWGHDTQCECVVDIDLDYFFYNDDKGKTVYKLLADAYVEQIFTKLAEARRNGFVRVLTMALSPRWCGGWANAQSLCKVACGILKVPFELPSPPGPTLARPN